MNGLKNFAAIAVVIADIIILFNSHLIDWKYGITMAIGTAIGGYIGARLSLKLQLNIIRYVVIVIGLATAIYLFSMAHII